MDSDKIKRFPDFYWITPISLAPILKEISPLSSFFASFWRPHCPSQIREWRKIPTMKICYTKERERERVLKQTYDQCYYLSSFLNSGRSFLVNRQESKKPHYPFNMFRHRMTRCTLHFRFHLSADWEELWYEHSVP